MDGLGYTFVSGSALYICRAAAVLEEWLLEVLSASRNRIMSLSVAVTFICLTSGSVFGDGGVKREIRQFTSIAPQELAQALQILVKDRHVQLVYRSELVSDRWTPGADGDLTLEEALAQLLVGSGLRYRYLGDNAITIVREESTRTRYGVGKHGFDVPVVDFEAQSFRRRSIHSSPW